LGMLILFASQRIDRFDSRTESCCHSSWMARLSGVMGDVSMPS
jgi:hypothetical protein